MTTKKLSRRKDEPEDGLAHPIPVLEDVKDSNSQSLKGAKGYLFSTDILNQRIASGAPGHIKEVFSNTDHSSHVSTKLFLVTSPQGDMILRTMRCPSANLGEIEKAKKDYEFALEISKQNVHVTRPLSFRKLEEAGETHLETLFDRPGVPLKVRIHDIQADEIISLARKTLDPLAFLEGKGLFPSDLNPENILAKDGDYSVIDIGKRQDSSTTQLLGRASSPKKSASLEIPATSVYSPPEVLMRADINARDKVTVYHWGKIMYECISKKGIEKMEKEAEKYGKKDKKKYEQFLEKVKMLEMPGDTNGYLTDLFIPILVKVLAFKPEDRPSFSTLHKLMGVNEAGKVSAEVTPVKTETSKLERKLKKAKTAAEVLNNTVNVQKKMIEDETNTIEKLKRKLEKAKTDSTAKAGDSEKENRELLKRLEEAGKTIAGLQEKMGKTERLKTDSQEATLTQIRQQVLQKSEEIADLKIRIKDTEKELGTLRKENYALKNNAPTPSEDLIKALRTKDAELKSAQEQIQKLLIASNEEKKKAETAAVSPYKNAGNVLTFGDIKDCFVSHLDKVQAECGIIARKKLRDHARELIDKSAKGLSAFSDFLGNSGGQTIALSLRCAPSIQVLDLGLCGIGTDGAKALGEAIQNHWSLKALFLGYEARVKCEKRESKSGVTQLDLLAMMISGGNVMRVSMKRKRADFIPVQIDLAVKNWNSIGLAGVRALAQGLRMNRFLSHLDLSYTGISNDAVYELANALSENATLRRLYLYKNGGITDKSGRSYAFRGGVKVVYAVA